jgi:hypothetical protein
MDHNTAMIEWLLKCPQVSRLYALWGSAVDGAMHYLRLNDSIHRAYLDGGLDQTLDCTILCYHRFQRDYHDPALAENLLSYKEAQAICDWVKEQDSQQHFPEIPGVYAVEPRPANPQIAAIEENGLVKYMVGIRVWYGP